MRVLFVVGRAAGGIGVHVDSLARHLRDAHADVEVVTDATTAHAFGWHDAHLWWPPRSPRRAVSAAADWHRVMRLAQTCDVVHAHGTQAALVAAPAVLRARPRPAFVVSLHNSLPAGTGPGATRLVAAAVRRADLVTGASADLTELADSWGARRSVTVPVASSRVAQLLATDRLDAAHRAGLRAALFAGLGLPADPDAPLVLTISRVAPQKDLETLINAERRSRAGATWVVIGGGDEPLRRRLIEASRGTAVHLLGPRTDVQQWWAAADVFALSSRWEARALVVQEAMAAEVPLVATAVGGIPDLVAGTGVLVPPGDPAALAAAVDESLHDPAGARARAAQARALAASWADPGAEARHWLGIYQSLLRR